MGTYKIKLDYRNLRQSKLRKSEWPYLEENGSSWYASEQHLSILRDSSVTFAVEARIKFDKARVSLYQNFPKVLFTLPDADVIDSAISYAYSTTTVNENSQIVYLGRDLKVSPENAFIVDKPGGNRRYYWQISRNPKQRAKTIDDILPEISSRIQDEDTKVVVSMGGGGLKAAAHLAFAYVLEALGRHHIDEIWGTSSGATSAIWFASGLTMEEVEKKIYWLYHKKHSILKPFSAAIIAANFVRDHLLPKKLRSKGVSSLVGNHDEMKTFLDLVLEGRRPHIPLYSVTFNISKMRTDVLSDQPTNPHYNDFIYHVPPIEAAAASGSVPVVFPPYKLDMGDGNLYSYLDGGITEPLPMKSIYRKWLIDKEKGLEKRSKLLIISSKLFSHEPPLIQPNESINHLKTLLLYESILVNVAVSQQQKYVESDPNVTHVACATPLEDMFMLDTKSIPLFIRMGKQHITQDFLDAEQLLAQSRQIRKTQK